MNQGSTHRPHNVGEFLTMNHKARELRHGRRWCAICINWRCIVSVIQLTNEQTDTIVDRKTDRQCVRLLGQAAASWHLERLGNSMGESDGPSSAHRKPKWQSGSNKSAIIAIIDQRRCSMRYRWSADAMTFRSRWWMRSRIYGKSSALFEIDSV